MTGAVLRLFTDVVLPRHLSLDSEGHLLVADRDNHHILLLNSQLELQRVLIDSNPQVKPWRPKRLCYNEQASILYVLHDSNSSSGSVDSNSHVELWMSSRLCYNEQASMLYVLHDSNSSSRDADIISAFNMR